MRTVRTLGLTPRERQVLRHLAKGRSNQAIAACLRISARTIQTHLARIYMKLGVETRVQAVLWVHGKRGQRE